MLIIYIINNNKFYNQKKIYITGFNKDFDKSGNIKSIF